MTLILRRLDAPFSISLGAAGLCRVGLCEVVGCFGKGGVIVRVVFLGTCASAA